MHEFGSDDVKNAHNVLALLQLALVIVLVLALFHTCGNVDGTLESEIAALNEEKTSLETLLSGSSSDIQAIQKASVRIGEVTSLLDEKEMRWLELSCR